MKITEKQHKAIGKSTGIPGPNMKQSEHIVSNSE